MPAPRVRTDHDLLKRIAQTFAQEAEITKNVLGNLKNQMTVLQNGDWIGKGATAFYNEMNGQVLPAMNRLVAALNRAAEVTREISAVMQQAEQDAAALFVASTDAVGGMTTAGGLPSPSGAAAGTIAASGPTSQSGITTFSAFGSATGARTKPGSPTPKPKVATASRLPPSDDNVLYYDRWPTQAGNLVGAGRRLRRWRDTYNAEALREQQEIRDDAQAELKETLDAQSRAIKALAAKELPKALNALRKADNEVYRLLKAYDEYGGYMRVSDVAADAAAKNALASVQKLKSAEAAFNKHELAAERDNLTQSRMALEARVAERQDAVTKVVGMLSPSVSLNPLELGGDALKMMIGDMTVSETRQLAEIDAKISALDRAIADKELVEARADLQAAKDELQGAFDKYVAEKMKTRIYEKAQWGVLDQLAAAERLHGTGTYFQRVQEANADLRRVGAQLREENKAYLKVLNTGLVGEAGKLADQVRADMKHISIHGPKDETWLNQATSSLEHLNRVEHWRQQELGPSGQLNDYLSEGKHLNVVDQAIAAADQALGNTVRDDHLIN